MINNKTTVAIKNLADKLVRRAKLSNPVAKQALKDIQKALSIKPCDIASADEKVQFIMVQIVSRQCRISPSSWMDFCKLYNGIKEQRHAIQS